MLCAVIKTLDIRSVQKANRQAQMIELRLDEKKGLPFQKVKELRDACKVPVIFKGGEEVFPMLSCAPDYVDLPWDLPPSFFEKIKEDFPKIKRICSLHDFTQTPLSFEHLFERPAELYKVASFAKSSLDALRMLLFVKNSSRPVIGLCMGEEGAITRILSPCVGTPFTYAPLEEKERTAPGQFLLKELKKTYRFLSLNQQTSLYGLIGDPVDKSRSHFTHNVALGKLGVNGVYTKMRVTEEELSAFFPMAIKLGFRGLSVTMPLKEAVVPFLDEMHDHCGAINTIAIRDGKLHGWNTDGKGALNAIEKREMVKGKHLVILGAGGAARAIAYEAFQRGAQVTLLNRTYARAKKVAEELGCKAAPLEAFEDVAKRGYDVLVNCTSVGMLEGFSIPVPENHLLEGRLVMDTISNPQKTPLLQAAEKKGCSVIEGMEMFIQQAMEQFYIWLNA